MTDDDLPEELQRAMEGLENRNEERRLREKQTLASGVPPEGSKPIKAVRVWVEDGVHCAIVRTEGLGHLCGYAQIPESHPWWGLAYGDEVPEPVSLDEELLVEEALDDFGTLPMMMAMFGGIDSFVRTLAAQVRVHGGLTFAETFWVEGAPFGWWIGFDCAHHGDAPPPEYLESDPMREFIEKNIAEGGAHIWTEDEVALEVSRLVTAIRSAQPVPTK